jgi:hypothetical protein
MSTVSRENHCFNRRSVPAGRSRFSPSRPASDAPLLSASCQRPRLSEGVPFLQKPEGFVTERFRREAHDLEGGGEPLIAPRGEVFQFGEDSDPAAGIQATDLHQQRVSSGIVDG